MDSRSEGPLTRMRRERKIALPSVEAERLARLVGERFCLNAPPEVAITSVYFDATDGRLTRGALEMPGRCLKVRTKEYDPDWSGGAMPRCVVEIKRHRGPFTRKRRWWMPRAALEPLFSHRLDELSAYGCPALAAHSALAPIGGDHGLSPVVAVTYRRRVYQVSGDLRLTFDRDVSFHRAASDLLLSALPLGPARLPPPFAAERRTIVELKNLTNVPEWLDELFNPRTGGFSKFSAAVSQLESTPGGGERAQDVAGAAS